MWDDRKTTAICRTLITDISELKLQKVMQKTQPDENDPQWIYEKIRARFKIIEKM